MKKSLKLLILSSAILGLATTSLGTVRAEETTPTTNQVEKTKNKYNVVLYDAKSLENEHQLKPVENLTIISNKELSKEELEKEVIKQSKKNITLVDRNTVIENAQKTGLTVEKEASIVTTLSGGVDTLENEDGTTVFVSNKSLFVNEEPPLKKTYKIYLLDASAVLSPKPDIEHVNVIEEQHAEILLEEDFVKIAEKNLPNGYFLILDHKEIISQIKDPEILKTLNEKYSNQVNGNEVITGFWVGQKSATRPKFVADETLDYGVEKEDKLNDGTIVVKVGTKPKREEYIENGFAVVKITTYKVNEETGEITPSVSFAKEPIKTVDTSDNQEDKSTPSTDNKEAGKTAPSTTPKTSTSPSSTTTLSTTTNNVKVLPKTGDSTSSNALISGLILLITGLSFGIYRKKMQ